MGISSNAFGALSKLALLFLVAALGGCGDGGSSNDSTTAPPASITTPPPAPAAAPPSTAPPPVPPRARPHIRGVGPHEGGGCGTAFNLQQWRRLSRRTDALQRDVVQ